jgi:hypothetical protein
VGRAVAALAADPQVDKKTGRVFSSWDLAEEYDFKDVDGRQPNFCRWLGEHMPNFKWRKCDDEFYRYWSEPDMSAEEIEQMLKEPAKGSAKERKCVA